MPAPHRLLQVWRDLTPQPPLRRGEGELVSGGAVAIMVAWTGARRSCRRVRHGKGCKDGIEWQDWQSEWSDAGGARPAPERDRTGVHALGAPDLASLRRRHRRAPDVRG